MLDRTILKIIMAETFNKLRSKLEDGLSNSWWHLRMEIFESVNVVVQTARILMGATLGAFIYQCRIATKEGYEDVKKFGMPISSSLIENFAYLFFVSAFAWMGCNALLGLVSFLISYLGKNSMESHPLMDGYLGTVLSYFANHIWTQTLKNSEIVMRNKPEKDFFHSPTPALLCLVLMIVAVFLIVFPYYPTYFKNKCRCRSCKILRGGPYRHN